MNNANNNISYSGYPLDFNSNNFNNLNSNILDNADARLLDSTFQSIDPIPIKVTRDQSDGYVNTNNYNILNNNDTNTNNTSTYNYYSNSTNNNNNYSDTNQFSSSNVNLINLNTNYKNSIHYSLANLNIFQNLPNESIRGVDDLSRMEMSLLSNIDSEVKWALKKYLTYSNKAPYMINLKILPHLLPLFIDRINNLYPIIENFDKSIIINTQNMDILQIGINSLLILRNLAQDMDSVQVLCNNKDLQKFILFILNKFELNINTVNPNATSPWKIYQSNLSYFNELIHYTLDLMEAISSYIAPAKKDDPFFQKLISILNFTKDRNMFISILRSLSRLLVRSKADEESAADNLDSKTLHLIVSQLLIDCDSELIIASFDFLYQYILPGNERIKLLLNDSNSYNILFTVLPKLLSYNIPGPNYNSISNTQLQLTKRLRPPPPTEPPQLSLNLFQQILRLDEPQRSSAWLRCSFEPVENAEFTQILLWRSYESKFAKPIRDSGRKLLPAVEFIKNVSVAFPHANAMVINDPKTGTKKFVIKGIQPRVKAVSISEGEIEANKLKTLIQSKFIDTASDTINPVKQNALPTVKFPSVLSDVSKVATTFLCLISNDSKGPGLEMCKKIKPIILHKLADLPPLTEALNEYMDNTQTVW